MKLPTGWEKFQEDVILKTRALSTTGIWNIDSDVIGAWLGNFQKSEHRYIALHILDRMIYRTAKMTESSYARFFATDFREYVQKDHGQCGKNIDDWMQGLKDKNCGWAKNILLCSVSMRHENGESGSEIVRMLSGDLLSESRILTLNSVGLTAVRNKTILIVDDFVGSGDQFSRFAKAARLTDGAKQNRIIYVPAMAYYKGAEKIMEANYGMDFQALEILTKQDQFFTFDPGAPFCGDDQNSEGDVIACYREMRKLTPTVPEPYWFGRDKSGLCVGFQSGCPNQSLGIMWSDGLKWHRLLRRRGSQ